MVSPSSPRLLTRLRSRLVLDNQIKTKVVLTFVLIVVVLVCLQCIIPSFFRDSVYNDYLLSSIQYPIDTHLSNDLSQKDSSVSEITASSDSTATTTRSTTESCVTIPILPLTSSVKHSHRPISHLTMDHRILTPFGLPPVSINYLNNSFAALMAEHLYPLANYQRWYESAVTHVWIALLQSLQGQESQYMVVDGGMNTGFYTTLTAVMGFDVHAFELQLDCFDVTKMLLRGNDVTANLYHIGISDRIQVIKAGEGCHPGYSIAGPPAGLNTNPYTWKHRTHQVLLLPLDVILDQVRQNRQIALIKLDLEGNEIVALRGLQRHLHAVHNIIMEVSPVFSSKLGVSMADMTEQFHRLEAEGFQPYLLWLPQINATGWFNATYLEMSGVKNTKEHPIVGANVTIGADMSCMLWEIVNYERLFTTTCTDGCNVLFSRKQSSVEE